MIQMNPGAGVLRGKWLGDRELMMREIRVPPYVKGGGTRIDQYVKPMGINKLSEKKPASGFGS